ncbi:MAG: hypothetical protein CMJ23_02915 [Phycisphaerae bacterium]|nr:hypothetical protein [Phycisphaerae bacterium]
MNQSDPDPDSGYLFGEDRAWFQASFRLRPIGGSIKPRSVFGLRINLRFRTPPSMNIEFSHQESRHSTLIPTVL